MCMQKTDAKTVYGIISLQTIACKKESPVHWVDVAVSTNGRAVALVDKEGYLWGGSSDFKVSCFLV